MNYEKTQKQVFWDISLFRKRIMTWTLTMIYYSSFLLKRRIAAILIKRFLLWSVKLR